MQTRKPRLIDLLPTAKPKRPFVTQDGTRIARSAPALKRVAPRRGDPPLDPRALARAAEAYDERLAKGLPMPKYPMALDAAPQDGRWLDDPGAVTTVLQFLLSKLSPADLAELDEHLTKGTEPQATDHRLPEGDLKRDLLNYTPKNRRTLLASLSGAPGRPMSLDEMKRADPDHGKSLHERFPNLNRLRG